MSRGLNRVMLIGNVGAEPEIRTTSGVSRVASVSLATNRSWKDKSGQKVEETEWHKLTLWGKLADIVEQWVKKGDQIYAEGRLHYSTTEHEGSTRYWTEIVADELVMLSGVQKPAGSAAGDSFGADPHDGPPV